MRKITVNTSLLAVLLAGIAVSGQGYDDLASNNNYNIIPPTPESFYKSKFGNTEINDFKGEPNVNIPLFSVSKKDIAINLVLKYIKSGVKVNDLPNSTGMNWILDTGGSITRTIYDKRDEFFGNSHTINHSLPPLLNNNDTQGWGAYIGLHNDDHEVDIFNYSISGYSGSFYMDENFNPVLITKDNNLKIETVGNFRENYAFKITTYDGLVYLFGGEGFTETTFNKETPALAGVTGFYLKQISSNKTNRSVNFIYENITPKTVILNEQQNVNIASDVLFGDACGGEGVTSNQINSSDNILHVTSLKRLKQIVADDNETFTFNYSDDNVIYNKLTEVVHSKNNNPIRKVTMDYLDKRNGNILERFFLNKVSFFEYKNSVFNKKEDYALEYNSPLDIPFRLSKEIDYLGFYNGKVNNTSLIPNINLFDNTNLPGFNSFADRTADFNYSVYGTLKSITYPTKGKTSFEYEPIKKGMRSNELNLEINNAQMTDIKELGQFDFIGGNINLSISLYSPDTSSAIKALADFKILDENNNEVYTHSMAVTKITNHLETDMDQFTLNPNKKYKFTYLVKNNTCSSCQGNVTITYKAMDPSNGAGVRLKRQYDVSENNTVNVKRIYYTNFDNISKDLFAYDHIYPNFQTTFYTHSNTSTTAEAETCASQEHRQYLGWGTLNRNIESSPISTSLEVKNDFLSSNGNTVYTYFNLADPMYENVTISYGGDYFEKGGEEKKYFIKDRSTLKSDLFIPNTMELPAITGGLNTNNIATGILSAIIPSAQRKLDRYYSFSNMDGKLLKSTVFYMKNNAATMKQSTALSYIFEDGSKIYNIIGSVLYPNLYSTPSSIINKYISSYPVITTQSFLSKVVTKEYMEDIPLSILDDSNVKKLITTKEYFYNNPAKQLTRQTVTTPENSITETNYQYAHEKNNQLMISKNMIGIPLETTTTQTLGGVTKTLEKSETVYPTAIPTYQSENLILPLSEKSYDKLNNTMSTDVTYDRYDEKGNLLQYTTKDGIPVTIIWGYNKTLPIAKIEGADYTSISHAYLDVNIISASNDDAADPLKEGLLLDALNSFRKEAALADKKITTYTYDPLIGVTSITPPSGVRQTYTYDSANRLKETGVRGKNGAGSYINKKVSENKYNYKP